MSFRQKDTYNKLIKPVLSAVGYYNVKKNMRKWQQRRKLIREDATLRKNTIKKINELPTDMFSKPLKSDEVVISLTSYGTRVAETLPIALYSLVTQTIKPGKIVVYLDKDNWSDERLPDLIKCLQKVGVDFRYCEDIRSYKKIVPALRDFPDNPIVTVDDDIFYNERMLEWLLESSKNLPSNAVVGLWACIVGEKDGKYEPYNTWQDCKMKTPDSEFALYTGYGTLYPPHIFDEEVVNEDVFMRLCPTADDIWMWVMEKRLHIPVYITQNAGLGLHRVINKRFVYFPEENLDSLYYENELMGNKNDEQLNNLIKYYNLKPIT